MNTPKIVIVAAAFVLATLFGEANAALTFTVEANGWPNAAHRQAAIDALQSSVNRYNAYGNFGNYNVYAYYNAGIPTAQASYLGSIGYGGTYPNERVTMHEMSHYLGTGTFGTPWDGARGEAIVDQFDGLEASLNGDGAHYWPYGLNFDSEGAEINKQRHVALLYAMRADMGIGSTASPSSAQAVLLTANDPVGTSGFNHASNWSDSHFAQPGTDYYTGNFALRTPNGYNSWTFVGDSLTVNNKNNPNGGLLYNGWGHTGIVTIKNLILDGGTVKHDQFDLDTFQLDGRVTVVSPSKITAANGNINVLSDVTGVNTLTIGDGAYLVKFLSEDNTFKGNIDVQGKFELADNADLRFVIKGNQVNNAISGAGADSVLLDGDFQFDTFNADISSGNFWAIVTAANATYGSNFTVSGFSETSSGVWADSTGFVFTEATGRLTHSPEPASLAPFGLAGLRLLRRRKVSGPSFR